MADLAEIGLSVNTRGIRTGQRELERLADSGDEAQRSFDRLEDELQDTNRATRRVNESARALNTTMGNTAGVARNAAAALGAYISVASGVGVIVRFEDALLGLQAVTRATSEEMRAFEEQSRALGATSVFSAEQAANAQRFLAQAGFDTNQILSATPDVLNLATAGNLSLAESADIASNVLGGMQLQVSELTRVTDVMAETAAASNTDIQQLGQALSTAAPLAAASSVSIEDTAAAIGALSNAGIQGSRAGTGLLGVIRQLSNVTDAGETALSNYGLSVEDVNIGTQGLTTVLDRLRDANISTADSFALFGSEAAPSALILAENSEQVEQLSQRLDDAAGSADEMAAIIGSGLSASFRSFNSQLSESVLQIGQGGLGAALQSVVDYATGVLAVYNDMTEQFAQANDLTRDQVDNLESLASAIENTTTILGSATAAYVAYRIAANAATVAQTAFNVAARANPIGLLVTAAGTLGGVMLTLQTETNSAAEAVRLLTTETNNLDEAQRAIAINQVEQERVRLTRELTDLIRQQTVEQERYNTQLDIYASNAQRDAFRTPATNPFSEEDIQTVDRYSDRIAELRARIAELDDATASTRGQGGFSIPQIVSATGEEETLRIGNNAEEIDNLTQRYQNVLTPLQQFTRDQARLNELIETSANNELPALNTALDNVTQEIADINSSADDQLISNLGQGVGSAVASAVQTQDWSNIGQSVGALFGQALGTAIAGPIGGILGGALGGALFGGSRVTGRSTTVSFAGGQASGTENTRRRGLFGSSTSRVALGSAQTSQLTNSISNAITDVQTSFNRLGLTVTTSVSDFSTTVTTSQGGLSGAVEEVTAEFVRANLGAISDFTRAGESYVQAFERLNNNITAVINSFSVGVGNSIQEAARAYNERQAEVIRESARQQIAEIQARIEEIRSRPTPTRETGSGNVVIDTTTVRARRRAIENLNNQIADLTVRLGTALNTATTQFTQDVLSAISRIESIDSDQAASRLNELASNYEQSYFSLTERIQRATQAAITQVNQFSDLGIDASTSLSDFRQRFEDYVNSEAFTPQGYARWLAAANALSDLNNAVDQVDSGGTFKSITDFVRELFGLAADGTRTLESARSEYQRTLNQARAGDEQALQNLTRVSQAYLDAAAANASSAVDVAVTRAAVASDLNSIVSAATGQSVTPQAATATTENTAAQRNVNMTTQSRMSNSSTTTQAASSNTIELNRLMETLNTALFNLIKDGKKELRIFERWEGEGLPATRSTT